MTRRQKQGFKIRARAAKHSDPDLDPIAMLSLGIETYKEWNNQPERIKQLARLKARMVLVAMTGIE